MTNGRPPNAQSRLTARGPARRIRGAAAPAGRDARADRQPAAAVPVHRLRRQQRRARGRRHPACTCATPRGAAYLADGPGLARHGPRLRHRRPGGRPACTRATPTRCSRCSTTSSWWRRPDPMTIARIARGAGACRRLVPPAPPPQEALPDWRRGLEGLRHSTRRDAEAIHHHYDVSNRFYELVLGPVDDLHLRRATRRPTRRWRRRRTTSTTWSRASSACSRACGCSTSAAAGAAWSCTPPSTTG